MVTIQKNGTGAQRLTGRVAEIVLWLAQEQERLNGPDKIRLEFNCSGGSVQPRVETVEKALKARHLRG